MDERGIALLRMLMSDVEGAPFPGTVQKELYAIWYEHAQIVAQDALQYLNFLEPGYGKDSGVPDGLE